MALISYSFSIAAHFGGKYDPDAFYAELQASPVLTIRVERIDQSGDSVDIWFRGILPQTEQDHLGILISLHTGEPLPAVIQQVHLDTKTTSDNRLRVAIEKSDASAVTFYSIDFTERRTWVEDCVEVANELATNTGDNLTYQLANPFVIDTFHGRLDSEDFDHEEHRVEVRVDGVLVEEQDPHEKQHHVSGPEPGDYVVGHDAGQIIFHVARDPTAEVRVKYCYENGSTFTVKPMTGKRLSIDKVEVQFASNIEITDSTDFVTFGYVGSTDGDPGFVPELNGMTIPSSVFASDAEIGALAPLRRRMELHSPELLNRALTPTDRLPLRIKRYKTMRNFLDDASKAYPGYPALGGDSWRGMQSGVYIFNWDYVNGLQLDDSLGLLIKLRLQHNIPFGGDYGTATFYCSSEDEVDDDADA
jgi:hypothetical protein